MPGRTQKLDILFCFSKAWPKVGARETSADWLAIPRVITPNPSELRNTENKQLNVTKIKKEKLSFALCVHIIIQGKYQFLNAQRLQTAFLKKSLPTFWHMGKYTDSSICLDWVFQILSRKQEYNKRLVPSFYFFYLYTYIS